MTSVPAPSSPRTTWTAFALAAMEWIANPALAGLAFCLLALGIVTWLPGAVVHLAPGRYLQDAVTVRPGITIIGPPAAIVSGAGGARIRDDKSGGFDSRGNANTFRYNIVTANVGAGIRLGGDTPQFGIGNSVYGNVITGNQAGGIKFQGTPQDRVCGNVMADNVDGDAVGTYAEQYQPAASCS